jgi:hypothetical protein
MGRGRRRSETIEPQLRARSIAALEIDVRQSEEAVRALVAPRFRYGQSAHEGLANFLLRGPCGASGSPETHPDFRSGRHPSRKIFEDHREFGIEMGRVARVGQQGEPQRRVGSSCKDTPSCGPGRKSVTPDEGILTLAKIRIRAGKRDLDFAENAANDVGEPHTPSVEVILVGLLAFEKYGRDLALERRHELPFKPIQRTSKAFDVALVDEQAHSRWRAVFDRRSVEDQRSSRIDAVHDEFSPGKIRDVDLGAAHVPTEHNVELVHATADDGGKYLRSRRPGRRRMLEFERA